MEQQIPACQRIFNEYVERLLPKMMESYGYGISSTETMRDWYSKLSYREEIERFLVCDARTFIRSLDNTHPAHSDPKFLNKLTWKMSDYFAQYTTQACRDYNPSLPMHTSPVYMDEARRIHKQLFDDFKYIINLRENQKRKRAERRNPTAPAVLKYKRHQAKATHMDNARFSAAILAEFNAAQKRPARANRRGMGR